VLGAGVGFGDDLAGRIGQRTRDGVRIDLGGGLSGLAFASASSRTRCALSARLFF